MPSLPQHLPATVEQLVKELDELNPEPVVDGVLVDPIYIQQKVYDAGRRSIVNELLRLRALKKEQ